ncbi:MAG: hypothetical protein NE330_04320 [Lentisphaeraceae bacterium]|nr:hypothetical protein [Lentisphaeraceae bacterium]
MPEEIDPNSVNIIGGPIDKIIRTPTRMGQKRILKAWEEPPKKIRLIGGDCDDDNSQPPTIILEREGDTITKIIVKCTCGRHAELVCAEEDDDETPNQLPAPENE